mmetsp:Transcript_23410/g.73760  ORF Transcript_23410/g.73760 Transcript_23410/m.73760 type:complete len:217 (+) Transcript_23410:278-928(+)
MQPSPHMTSFKAVGTGLQGSSPSFPARTAWPCCACCAYTFLERHMRGEPGRREVRFGGGVLSNLGGVGPLASAARWEASGGDSVVAQLRGSRLGVVLPRGPSSARASQRARHPSPAVTSTSRWPPASSPTPAAFLFRWVCRRSRGPSCCGGAAADCEATRGLQLRRDACLIVRPPLDAARCLKAEPGWSVPRQSASAREWGSSPSDNGAAADCSCS